MDNCVCRQWKEDAKECEEEQKNPFAKPEMHKHVDRNLMPAGVDCYPGVYEDEGYAIGRDCSVIPLEPDVSMIVPNPTPSCCFLFISGAPFELL